jgi:hypothetical protein
MNAFLKIMAGLGALLITATTLGLPAVAGYCIARTRSATAAPLFASSKHPGKQSARICTGHL